MTNEEAVALATKTNEVLVKVSNETDALLREIEKLEEIASRSDVTPELAAALSATHARANAIDGLVTDTAQPE